ncbi:MAG TPA: hypothetical protein DSN98_06075, partial [Thermoplasmata archaeon]
MLTFSETVNEPAAETSAWTVAGATVITVPGVEAGTTMTITTTGLSSTSSTPAVAYVAASGNLLDASAATNEMANGATANAADQVPPTFTADRTALNTVVLTFSETVTGTAILNSFTVVGASAVTNSAPSASTTVTLTTTGLTATDGTPNVGYVSATGDIKDNSVAQNEVANGGAVAATDHVSPTFTAARTALNTVVLTFSETVNEPAAETSAWTVAGATVITVPGVEAGTTMTITTTGLSSTSSTPAVAYVAASGNLLD